jgi:carbonic anhydrase/acetyltransferase-like protein (isoleucine patch superfamily)
MTVRALGDKVPRIDPSAWVSEAAYVVGDVEIGAGSSVWPGAVVRGDFGRITIGANTHVEDNCVVHAGSVLTIGDNVLVGHSVVLHGRSVGDNCLLGNGAILLDDCEVGELSMVAAGSVVTAGTRIRSGSFVVGTPATVRPARPEQLAFVEGLSRTDVGYGPLLRQYREAGL